jgi:hypothetical protein
METTLTTVFRMLRNHVEETGERVIAVCPNISPIYAQCRLVMVSSIPSDSYFSGRTARFQNGGTLSLFTGDASQMSENKPFSLAFLGWGTVGSQNTNVMQEWRRRATKVISTDGLLS